MFPRKEIIDNYSLRDWAEILENIQKIDNKKLLEKYEDMETMIKEDFFEVLSEINKIWEHITNL